MAVYAAVFSPPAPPTKGAWAMASALGEARLLDVTLSPAAAQVFSQEDLVVFGAPVYGAGSLQGL